MQLMQSYSAAEKVRWALGAKLPAYELPNIIPDLRRYFFGIEGAGGLNSFLVGLEKIDAVGADFQMMLKIPLAARAQFIVNVCEQ